MIGALKDITIITDVDGILSSSNLGYDKSGKAFKTFSVNDSLMVKMFQEYYGAKIIALTGDKGNGLDITMTRCKELDLQVRQCPNYKKFDYIKSKFNIKDIVYFGDDIFDVSIFENCFFSGTVANAPSFVKSKATIVSEHIGGSSALTDLLYQSFVKVCADNKNILEKIIEPLKIKHKHNQYVVDSLNAVVKNGIKEGIIPLIQDEFYGDLKVHAEILASN